MAILQSVSAQFPVYGDSVATTAVVDISGCLKLSPVFPEYASTLITVGGTGVTGGSVSGVYLTVNFSSAPAGAVNVNFTVGV